MFDVGESLRAGLDRAQQQMNDAQSAVARSNAGSGGRSVDAAMANCARAAIFSEALLGALHERLAEVKMVTK
jgi:hypothetical protein